MLTSQVHCLVARTDSCSNHETTWKNLKPHESCAATSVVTAHNNQLAAMCMHQFMPSFQQRKTQCLHLKAQKTRRNRENSGTMIFLKISAGISKYHKGGGGRMNQRNEWVAICEGESHGRGWKDTRCPQPLLFAHESGMHEKNNHERNG